MSGFVLAPRGVLDEVRAVAMLRVGAVCRLLFRLCRWGRGGVVVVGFGAAGASRLGRAKGWRCLFGGGLGVGLAVADGEGGLVLGDGLVAIGLDVVEAAEVDVGPGEGAGVFVRSRWRR